MIPHPIFVKQSSFSIMRNSIISLLLLFLFLASFAGSEVRGQVAWSYYCESLPDDTDLRDPEVNNQYYLSEYVLSLQTME